MQIKENALVRLSFIKLLQTEFDLFIREDEPEKAELAARCITVYKTPEAFYAATGWARDNPECAEFDSLIKQRTCRRINGEVWYFSRLLFEEGLEKMGCGENCDAYATTLRPQSD